MTNRQWLIEKVQNASDEELAEIFVINEPECDDPWNWRDRYTNPFHRQYKMVEKSGLFGSYENTEEVYDNSRQQAERNFYLWLKQEHNFEEKEHEVEI